MTRVKICGMTSAEDVALCAAAGADAVGFIFADGPRKLSVDAAKPLTAAVPSFVTAVGVFANDAPDLVRAAVAACRLDVLQFSGDEPLEVCGSFGRPTIVAARGRQFTAEQLRSARALGILVDSWSSTEFGGTGRTVDARDVERARAWSGSAQIILAGGLAPGNVAGLIRACRPDAVDVRSGVERDGKKHPGLVCAFIAAAHAALDSL